MLDALDSEISRLQQARIALAGLSAPKRRGRPKATSTPSAGSPTPAKAVKGTMSAAGRKRVAEAQRKRWAKQKAAAKKAAKKTSGNPAKKAAKNAATKPSAKKVTVTKVPAKKQPERRPRVPKKAPAKHALSGASETVAGPKGSQE
jgi:hypothetical protein